MFHDLRGAQLAEDRRTRCKHHGQFYQPHCWHCTRRRPARTGAPGSPNARHHHVKKKDRTMAKLSTIAQDIADRLSLITGEAWSHNASADAIDHAQLQCQHDQATIQLMANSEPGRLIIRGVFGDEHRHADKRHRITVAKERPALDIAREIARRLLPPYRATRAAALAAYDQELRDLAWRDAAIAELVAIGGGRRASMNEDMFYNAAGRTSFRARVSAYSGVSFERIDHLPVEVARRILEILRDTEAAEQPDTEPI
jgi:hypothetical protein